MKPLYRFALLAFVTAAALGTATAQTTPTTPPASSDSSTDKHSPEARIEHRLKELTDKLGLTQGQQDQIKPILVDSGKQMKALFDDKSLSKEDREAKLKDLREAANGKIRGLLTADQQKTFDTMAAHHHHDQSAS